jgi:glutathione S-transferase
MIKIHHLGASRSDRIIWLCEELALSYELISHDRNPETQRAPESLWAVNPLGKSPVVQDGDNTVFESGAIVEYLLARYGDGHLKPEQGSKEWIQYLHWMHCAESTLMMPILFPIIAGAMGMESELLPLFMGAESQTLFNYAEAELDKHDHIASNEFTAADVMVAYTLLMAESTQAESKPFASYPAIESYLLRIKQRPAFIKAAAKF